MFSGKWVEVEKNNLSEVAKIKKTNIACIHLYMDASF